MAGKKCYSDIKNLDKSGFYIITVNDDLPYREMNEFSEFLKENGIKHVLTKSHAEIKKVPVKEKVQFLESIKKELGLNEETDTGILKVHKDGTVEIEFNTITDERFQYNDLYIQYLEKSNIVVIGYDLTPAKIMYQFKVIKKGEIVKFKAKNEVGIFAANPGLRIFDTENMELL